MEAPTTFDLSELERAYNLSRSVRGVLDYAVHIAVREGRHRLGTTLLLAALYESAGNAPSSSDLSFFRRLLDGQPGVDATRILKSTSGPTLREGTTNVISGNFREALEIANELFKHDGVLAIRHLVVGLLQQIIGQRGPNGAGILLERVGADAEVLLEQYVRHLCDAADPRERAEWAKLLPQQPAATSPASTATESVPKRTKRPDLKMLSDAAVTSEGQDQLGYAAYATGLADVVGHKDLETPFTLAINAPWGAGKTSLANLLEAKLQQNRGPQPLHIICRFNAWMHDDAPKLGTAFAAEVARTAGRHRVWWRRLFQPLPAALGGENSSLVQRLKWLVPPLLVVTFTIAAVLAFAKQGTLEPIAKVLSEEFAKWLEGHQAGAAKWSAGISVVIVCYKAIVFLLPAATKLNEFIVSPESVAAQGGLADIAKQLGGLIKHATRGKRRFVIFVDDLERCQPPRAVDVLEVINQLVAHPDVVTVILADMQAVTACADIKYKELAERYIPNDGLASTPDHARNYGRLYVQKIIQLQFDLPPLDRNLLKHVAKELTPELEARAATAPAAQEPRSDLDLRLNLMSWGIIIVSGVVGFLVFGRRQRGYDLDAGVAAVIFGIVASGFVRGVVLRVLNLRHERTLKEVDSKLLQALEKGDEALSAKTVPKGVEEVAGANKSLVQERLRKLIVNDSAVSAQVDAVLTDFIAPLPRYAKRAINRARFALGVAFERGMLDSEGTAVADAIGKWVCLLERWPDLAQVLLRSPTAIEALEDAATRGPARFAIALTKLVPTHAHDAELRALLEREPHFGASLEQIVRFEPPLDAPSPNASTRAAPSHTQPIAAVQQGDLVQEAGE